MYTNGIRMLNCQNSGSISIIPKATRVVAVSIYNVGDSAYIVADFSNGYQTNYLPSTGWKCTDEFYTGWADVDYDDMEWSQAIDKGPNNMLKEDSVRKISTESVLGMSSIYCRGHMGKAMQYSIS